MGDAKVSHEQEHLISLYHYTAKVDWNLGWSMHLKTSEISTLKRLYTLAAGHREICLKLGKNYPSCRLDFILPKCFIQAAEEGKTSIVSANTKHCMLQYLPARQDEPTDARDEQLLWEWLTTFWLKLSLASQDGMEIERSEWVKFKWLKQRSVWEHGED